MKQIIKIGNRTISQISQEDGIIEAVNKLKSNERLSFIDPNAIIGENTEIYYYVYIYGKARIGKKCLIGSHVTIQGDNTIIGNNVRVGDFTFIPSGTIIEDNCFLSQHVSICNDKYPKSGNKEWKNDPVIIRKGAIVGSNVALLPGIELGEECMIGAGSVVTKSVPPKVIWAGNPAKLLVRKISIV